MQSSKSLMYTKIIGSVVLFVLSLVIFYITYSQRQNLLAPRAWSTSANASTKCDDSGTGIIEVSFTNTEKEDSDLGMKVTVVDDQTGKSIDLGTVNPGQTVTGKINTGKQSLSEGTVRFKLSWTDNHSGTDTKSATYNAIQCIAPSPTVSPTETVTPIPSVTISVVPTDSPTPTVSITTQPSPSVSPSISPSISPTTTITTSPTLSPSISPTISPTTNPSATVTPTTDPSHSPTPTVTNSPTPNPSYTPVPTWTPQPTWTPPPGSTATPTPTEIILAVNNTNTPTPQGASQPTIPSAGVPIAWFVVLIPLALLTIGLIF